jgi:cytochrome c biogenesis protein CcmG, thiol:disulfide interchange protein DsbE
MGLRLPLLAFVALLVAAVSACAGREAQLAPPRERLPEVSVIGLDRQATSLPALTRGRPALVALWATWCKSCAKELAELDRLQVRVQGRALVVAVAVGEPYDTVRDFVAPRGLRYAQLIDEQFQLADALGTERVPSTLVVDRAGNVRYSGGALDGAALAALREAIGE